jgi:hypothetical protein
MLQGVFTQNKKKYVAQLNLGRTGRVTRLGEFSPIECLFTLGSVCKLKMQHKFGGYFFTTVKVASSF